MRIHPKTSGAGFGSALGVVIVGILHSFSGVHVDPTLSAAIPALLSTFGAWIVPSPDAPKAPTHAIAVAPAVDLGELQALKERLAQLESEGKSGKAN